MGLVVHKIERRTTSDQPSEDLGDKCKSNASARPLQSTIELTKQILSKQVAARFTMTMLPSTVRKLVLSAAVKNVSEANVLRVKWEYPTKRRWLQ